MPDDGQQPEITDDQRERAVVYRVPPEAAALPLRDARRLAKGKRPRRREL